MEKIIEKYLDGNVSRSQFGEWLDEYYYELLDAYKFRELEYLKIYPFIVELQDVDYNQELELHEKIEFIESILNGEISYSYECFMSLEKRNESDWLNSIWNRFNENGIITIEDMEDIHRIKAKLDSNIIMISDMYMREILTIFEGLPILSDGDFEYNYLYMQDITINDIRTDIDRILKIISGKKVAKIMIYYHGSQINYVCM